MHAGKRGEVVSTARCTYTSTSSNGRAVFVLDGPLDSSLGTELDQRDGLLVDDGAARKHVRLNTEPRCLLHALVGRG